MSMTKFKAMSFAFFLATPCLVDADEAAEQMVQDALPVMYHTCASVIEEADGDETYVLAVVEKMTALSIYNRQIDIGDHATSDEDKAALRETFLTALSEGCSDDKDALLGGVVDNAVKTTLGL
ncbi:hypothetical protein [Ruegeria meonggei]|uniref:hypothetical protein n=1 Tax=Ruegeria meonggei TaxID=1446476 RepID=UPI00366FE873